MNRRHEEFFTRILSATIITIGILASEKALPQTPVRTASISGRVTNAPGAPLSASMFVVTGTVGYRDGRRTFLPSGIAQPDSAGTYSFQNLSAGEYYLRIEGLPGSVGAYYPGVNDIRDALRIPVTPGQQLVGIDFPMANAPVFKISGRVVGGPALPNGRLTVEFVSVVSADPRDVEATSAPRIANRTGGANGEFEISLPAGLWDIFPLIPRPLTATGSLQFAAGRGRVLVTDRDVDGVMVPITASDIYGRFDIDGQPSNWPNRVSLVPRESMPSLVLSHLGIQLVGITGNFSFSAVPPGNYSLRPDAIPAGFYLADIRVGSRSVYDDGILIVGNEQLQPVQVSFRSGGGAVQVRLSGAPVQQQGGPRVLLVPTGARRGNILLYKHAALDRSTTYTFTNVAPGEYRVFAFEALPPGGAEQNPEFMEPYQDRGVLVNVIDGETATVDVRWIPSTP
jgi:hypothetical protein